MFWYAFFRVPATGRGFPYIQQLQYEGFFGDASNRNWYGSWNTCQFRNYFPKIPPTANVQILGIGSPSFQNFVRMHFCASFHPKKGWTVNLRESLPVGQMAIFSTFDRCIARKLRFLSFSEGKDFRILIAVLWGPNAPCMEYLPSRELIYPTLGKSSSKVPCCGIVPWRVPAFTITIKRSQV